MRDFVSAAASELGISIRWTGRGVDEQGFDDDGKCIVAVDPRYFRPTEVESLLGDASMARKELGWYPRTAFKELVAEMAMEDLRLAQRDDIVRKAGYSLLHRTE